MELTLKPGSPGSHYPSPNIYPALTLLSCLPYAHQIHRPQAEEWGALGGGVKAKSKDNTYRPKVGFTLLQLHRKGAALK